MDQKKKRKWNIMICVCGIALGMLLPLAHFKAEAEGGKYPSGYTPIYTIEDLYSINANPDGNYMLMNDIDMTKETSPGGAWDSGCGWRPLDTFTGIFDGNGYRIKGMHIYGDAYGLKGVGLFSETWGDTTESKHAEIKNLGLVDVDIQYTSSEINVYIGGIVGQATYTRISNCYVTGKIVHNGWYLNHIGGLAGNGYKFFNCFNAASIADGEGGEETRYKSGISVYGIFSCCYNCGAVEGYPIGSYWGPGCSRSNTYSLFGAATIAEDGVKILTDAQMKTAACFAGFDFKNTWEYIIGEPYPQLQVKHYTGGAVLDYSKVTAFQELDPEFVSITPSQKFMIVKWKRIAGAEGYELVYEGNSGEKTITIKDGTTVTKTITGLKSNSEYRIAIRAYCTYEGEKYYTNWDVESEDTLSDASTYLNITSASIKKGKAIKLTLKNVTFQNSSAKVVWQIKSGKKYVTLKNKKRSSVTVKGIKKGKAKVTGKINGVTYTCIINVKKK